MIAGAYLRFANLGAAEMSADEGASWAAASAPSIREVLALQDRLNPGKAGLHDVALHLWIREFGDSLAAMRALSACAGTLAIALVFLIAREMLGWGSGGLAGYSDPDRDTVAAVAALICAVNLLTIKYSRELRMYPLLLDAILAQAACFLRAARRGGVLSYAGVAIFTALAIAAHLTAIVTFGAEGVWLACLVARERRGTSASDSPRAIWLGVALVIGAALLAPLAPAVLRSTEHAALAGEVDWIRRPAWWAPLALFNKATGTFAFPVMAALAAWGVISAWKRARRAVSFALVWMWAPPTALVIASYALRPVFVERYLLSCFVPFFILVALGIQELRSNRARAAALGLTVALALGHVYEWRRKPHDSQWREAVRVALLSAAGGDSIAVAPDYAVNVVRYYLRGGSLVSAVPAGSDGTHANLTANIAIVADQGVAPGPRADLQRQYPDMLARLRGVAVRRR